MTTIIDGGGAATTYEDAPVEDGGGAVVDYGGSLGITWVDTNGVTWDLLSGPVRITTAGLKGLGLPNVDWQQSIGAVVDGAVLDSWRVEEREVFVPIRFKDEAMTDTTGIQRTFWSGLKLGAYGSFVVTDKLGAARTLTMRIRDDGGMAYKTQPDRVQVESIGLTFQADDPWWYGPARTSSYQLGDLSGVDFFGGGDPALDGTAPDFYIVTSQGSTMTTLRNPGDEDAWVQWGIGGPSTAFSVGVDGHPISAGLNIDDGSLLTIDTDPRVQLAYLDGVKVPFREFTSLDFARVPAGESVPISISVVGSGLITATFRPKYVRGF